MQTKCFSDINVLNIESACPNECSGNGFCKSKSGCQCKIDYILHDCSLKIKCREDCNRNGLCKTNAKCFCFSGWTGDTCSSIINCPKNCTSETNGNCELDGKCKCNEGFLGNDCGNNTKLIDVNPLLGLINSNEKSINETTKMFITKFNTTIDSKSSNCLNDCSGNGECNYILKKCLCRVNRINRLKLIYFFYFN